MFFFFVARHSELLFAFKKVQYKYKYKKVGVESNLRCHSPTASWVTWPSSPTTTQNGCIPVRMRYGEISSRPSRPFGAWSPTLQCSESTTTEDCRSSTQTTSCTWNCGLCSQRCVQGRIQRHSGRSLVRFAVTKTCCVCRSAVWVGWQHPRQGLDSEDLPGCHPPVQRRASGLFRCQNDLLGPQVAAAFHSSSSFTPAESSINCHCPSGTGVSNMRPGGRIRPANMYFSGPQDDFAKFKKQAAIFFKWRFSFFLLAFYWPVNWYEFDTPAL